VPAELDARVRALLEANDAREAAALAIRTLGPPVLRYLRAILRDEDDTKDAFSHWAESVWRGLPGFRWESALQTWAHRLAFHSALALRDDAWRRHAARLEATAASRLAETLRTRTAAKAEQRLAALRRLREELTLEEQTLLQLRVDQGLSWVAIAGVLAEEGARLDPGTVAKRYERLKARLAKMLRRAHLDD
jgi:RNA polymerase sigma-70 factor (ECF subfamily)